MDYLMELLGLKKPAQPKNLAPQGRAVDNINPISPNQGIGMNALSRILGGSNTPEKYNKQLQKQPAPRKPGDWGYQTF